MANASGSANVTTSAADILPTVNRRSGLILTHVSGGDVWLKLGGTAVVGEGFSVTATNTPLVLTGDHLEGLKFNVSAIGVSAAVIAYQEIQ